MLQKTQSTHLNRWKQALIIPLLIAFVFLFNTEVIAKEITTSTPTPIIETNTGEDSAIGDLVVVITKNTTFEELKAYKKLFKSKKIKFEYSDVDFNSKGEISSIALTLTTKNAEAANGKFATIDDKAISDIQLGKRGDELFIKSQGFKNKTKGLYTFKIDSESIKGDGENQKIIIRTNEDGKSEVNTWIQKDSVKTINIRRTDGEKIIIVNGKRVSPDEMIETEIEIKQGNENGGTYVYRYSSDSDYDNDDDNEEEEEVEVKIIKSQDSKIVFNNSDSKEKPLIIVDGKEISYKKFKKIDTNKIESVNVLKGDNAIEKYGKKAKNGVIVVKTKKKK